MAGEAGTDRPRAGNSSGRGSQPAATRVLKKALQEGFPRKRLILVVGIMADKDMAKMLADLIPRPILSFLPARRWTGLHPWRVCGS